jgi:hypothetical protein
MSRWLLKARCCSTTLNCCTLHEGPCEHLRGVPDQLLSTFVTIMPLFFYYAEFFPDFRTARHPNLAKCEHHT